jgi:hypothetical protein
MHTFLVVIYCHRPYYLLSFGNLAVNPVHFLLTEKYQKGNHVAKFGKDPIYRTKVIARKQPLSKMLFIVTVTLTFDVMTPK